MIDNHFGHLVLSGSVLSWCFSIPLGILLVIFFFFLNLSPWFTRKRQHFVQSSVPPHCFFTTSKSHKALSNHSLNNYGFQFRMSFSVICTHAHLKITIPTSCYVLLSLVMLRYSHKLTVTIQQWYLALWTWQSMTVGVIHSITSWQFQQQFPLSVDPLVYS